MSKIKIIIDEDQCIGCNTCPMMDPEIFELDEKTYKAIIKKQPEKMTSALQSTISSCPVDAIIYTTEEDK